MALFVLINDVHLTDWNRQPSSCTETYTEDLFGLLAQAWAIARQRHAAAIVIAGDVFHLKAPSRNSHKLVLRLQTLVARAPCPVFIVPGNHDLQHDRLDSLHVSQPLGVVLNSPKAHLLQGWAGYDEASFYPLYGVPWLQGYGNYAETGEEVDARVGQALGSYRREAGELLDSSQDKPLVVTHAPLYPPGRELPYEYFPAERWAEAMDGHGAVWYGHVHEDHGDYIAGGVTFANYGALSRGSLHEYNLTREVAIGTWDTETGTFGRIKLDAKPAEQVFRLREKAEVTDMQGRLDSFLEGISGTTLEVLSTESVLAHVRTLGLGKEAEDLIEELLR